MNHNKRVFHNPSPTLGLLTQPTHNILSTFEPTTYHKPKRSLPNLPSHSKRSKITCNENMHVSLANTHIQETTNCFYYNSTRAHRILSPTRTTMISKERVSIVRLRLICIKKLARNKYHDQQQSINIMDVSPSTLSNRSLLTVKEAGLSMPLTSNDWHDLELSRIKSSLRSLLSKVAY